MVDERLQMKHLRNVPNTSPTRVLHVDNSSSFDSRNDIFLFSASAIHCWFFLELPQLCLTDAVLFSKCTFYILAKPKKTVKTVVKKRNATVLLHELSSSITQLSFSLKLMKI